MAKKKDDSSLHMRFVSVVPLEKPGVIEFSAWEKAKWLGIWLKPFNQKTSIAHLAFLDCPTLRQITFRILFLEGQAQLPIDPNEEWAFLGLQIWRTQRSFGTLWMSQNCYAKADELKRGALQAIEVEARPIVKPPLEAPEEEEAYIP